MRSINRQRKLYAEWVQKQKLATQQKTPPSVPKKSVPKKSGQLWEPCERCGEEPVYMPLNLCALCWPKK